MAISEITGLEGEVIQLQDIMVFKRSGVRDDGTVIGEFRATGIRPQFLQELESMGLKIKSEYFDPSKAQ